GGIDLGEHGVVEATPCDHRVAVGLAADTAEPAEQRSGRAQGPLPQQGGRLGLGVKGVLDGSRVAVALRGRLVVEGGQVTVRVEPAVVRKREGVDVAPVKVNTAGLSGFVPWPPSLRTTFFVDQSIQKMLLRCRAVTTTWLVAAS